VAKSFRRREPHPQLRSPGNSLLSSLRDMQLATGVGLSEDDMKSNESAIAHEGDVDKQDRILPSYHTSKGTKIWMITECDRSVTTLLLPEEY
jgi:hypothetical protein